MIAGPLRVTGRTFVNDAGIFRPLFVSSFGTLGQLARGDEAAARSYLEWAAQTGFVGVRLFCGNLPWLPQTNVEARAVLRRALDLARECGLYVEVTALTGSGEDPRYDEAAHVSACAQICADAGNAILETANEPYHSTQSDATHKRENLMRWARNAAIPWACGAAEIDELDKPADQGGSYPMGGGPYATVHLRRSQEWFIQIARLREAEEISRHHNCPAMNNEPIGWAEQASGSRLTNPEAFFMMGAVCRVMELGCIGHGSHALTSMLPDPVQQACAEALIRGWTAVDSGLPTDQRAKFANGHWAESPFTGTFFAAGEPTSTNNRVWRISSGLAGNVGVAVCSGVNGDPGYRDQGGWRRVRLIDEMPRVQIWEVAR